MSARVPDGACPDGYGRVDDDETGTCYPDDDIVNCDNGAIVLDEEDCAIYDPNPPADPMQVCYFEPNDPVCDPVDGQCPEGMGFNEDEQCIPHGDCPDGYGRLDDDETGRCYAEHAMKTCPNGEKVLQSQACPALPVQPAAEANNDTSSEAEAEPEPEPITCQEGFVLENGKCAALDSNCGGVPCTASDKEDSTTSDPVPGTSEPETEASTSEDQTETQDEEIEAEPEQEEEETEEEEPQEEEEIEAEE